MDSKSFPPDSAALVRHPDFHPAINRYPDAAAYSDDNESPDSGGFLEYFRILRRHKGLWLIFAFLGALAGFVVTLPQTPIYQVSSSIEIDNLNDNFLNMRQNNPVVEGSSDNSEIPTQIKILQSRALMARVVVKLKAKSSSDEAQTRASLWRTLLKLPAPAAISQRDRDLGYLARSLKVAASGSTRVVEIKADSPSPSLAADFVNTLTSEFIQQNMESRWKSTERTSEWLGHQLDDMRVKLERSEDNLQQYARNSGLIFTDEKTNVSEEKLRQLQAELSAATGDRIAKQSRKELAETSPPDALPDIFNDTSLRETENKIRDLRTQIADLGAVYTPEYAKVRRAQAEVEVLQSTFERDRSDILRRIKNEYQEASRRERLLSEAYATQTHEVSGQGEKSIQYNILKREVDSNRQLYDAMLAQLKESSIASAMRASNVRVVDPAQPPTLPYKPNPLQSAGIGGLAGLFLGAAFIVVRERADRTIQQPGETQQYLDLPELGIIPSNKNEAALKTIPLPSIHSNLESERVELITWQRKPSMTAESFRSAIISILFTGESGLTHRTLAVTSAGPAEGKSTVTSNLAIAMAEVGQRVLLVDADLRRPRVHNIFSMRNEEGLSNLLRDRAPLNGDRSLGGLVKESPVPGLFVLTSGPATSSATSLLYGPRMRELLAYLRDDFDTILIDTPPMLQISDARVLGRIADGVIMVVRANVTTKTAVLAACQRFREDGTTVLGTILNDWNPKQSPDGYYGYYSGRYAKYSQYYKSDNR